MLAILGTRYSASIKRLCFDYGIFSEKQSIELISIKCTRKQREKYSGIFNSCDVNHLKKPCGNIQKCRMEYICKF